MASGFPGSPRLMKGGIVAYQLPDLVPNIIVFQYNPDEVSRSITPDSVAGGGRGRGDTLRVNGPPAETITMTVEIDAVDQLESPGSNGVTVQSGLHPAIAALEKLAYPPFAIVAANEILAFTGSAFIAAEQAPLALLIWGARRVLPVRLTSLSFTEQAFDSKLNPIRLSAALSLSVLTYRDLDITNPGYWVYMASFTQKQVMAGLNLAQDTSSIASMLPF